MRRSTLAVLGLAVALAVSMARADDASRLKLATEVVDTAHAADNMRTLMPTFMGQMRAILAQQGSVDSKSIDSYLHRFQQRFNEGIPRFVQLVAQVYAKEFSEDDLNNLLAFYKSPTGQHLLGKQTMIAQSMIMAGQEWGKSVAQQVIAEMQQEKAAAPAPKL